jgi:hypothetical protein
MPCAVCDAICGREESTPMPVRSFRKFDFSRLENMPFDLIPTALAALAACAGYACRAPAVRT